MQSEWLFCRLDELASAEPGAIAIGPFGSRLKAESYTAAGVALIRGTNLAGSRFLAGEFVYITEEKAAELGNANLKPEDLVFPHRGNIGAVGLVPGDGNRYVLSTSLMKITLDTSRACPAFYYYFFRSERGQAELLKNASQVGTPGIATPLTSLRSCFVPYPSLKEQEAAVSILSALDNKIILLRETNATLEAIAQVLFKSWFVDFDPVRAKAEGREPEGMPPEVADLFPSEFEDWKLGEIPMGWRVGTLADISALNPESWTAKNHPATVAYIDLANTKDNVIAGISEYAFDEAPSRARRVLRGGDTIIGTVRPGNRSFAYIHEPPSNLTASTGFAVLRPSALEKKEFLYLSATQGSSIEHLAHVADGAAYPAVRPEVVAGIQCVVPSDSIMRAFHDLAAPLLASISENQQKAQILNALRDALLPQLMSGKLRIPAAQEHMEVALA